MKTKVIKALSAEELKNINGGFLTQTGTDMEGNIYIMKPDGTIYGTDKCGNPILMGDFIQPHIFWT